MKMKVKNERERVMSTKILVIDNDPIDIEDLNLGLYFPNNPNIITALCHSVEDAKNAIDQHCPKIIFCDHFLTSSGNEGFKIFKYIEGKGIKFYTTTSSDKIGLEYKEMGIERLGKYDNSIPDKIRSILSSKKENEI